MKKLITKTGLLVGAALAMCTFTTPAKADQGLTQIKESSPLYLDQAPNQVMNGNMGVRMHVSHQSHESHVSHQSHYSGS